MTDLELLGITVTLRQTAEPRVVVKLSGVERLLYASEAIALAMLLINATCDPITAAAVAGIAHFGDSHEPNLGHRQRGAAPREERG